MNARVHTPDHVDYTGHSRNALDGSRRVMLPAKWRGEGAAQFTMLPWPIGSEDRVLVLPPERWREMLAKLKTRSLSDPGVAALEQEIAENAVQVSLDKVGRLTLGEELANLIGAKDEVELVGRLDKFEIWEPKKREAARAQNKKLAVEALKTIDL